MNFRLELVDRCMNELDLEAMTNGSHDIKCLAALPLPRVQPH